MSTITPRMRQRHPPTTDLPTINFGCHSNMFMRLCISLFTSSITDPNFVVSSSRDHAKESFKAQTGMERIVSVCVCVWGGGGGEGVHVSVCMCVCGGRGVHPCDCLCV